MNVNNFIKVIKYFSMVYLFTFYQFCSENKNGTTDEKKDLAETEDEFEMVDFVEIYETEMELESEEIELTDIVDEEFTSPFEGYCRACRRNSDCPEGGACLHFENGEMSCSIPCQLPDDCPAGASCENVIESDSRQCKPLSGTCVWDRIGDPCRAWGCSGRYDTCSNPAGTNGYCTHKCGSNLDCEAGFNKCLDRGDGVNVCTKDPDSPPMRCGKTIHSSGIGSPCDNEACPQPESFCADTLNPSIPAFCTRLCNSDADCSPEENAICTYIKNVSGPQKYCLPDECRCLANSDENLFDHLLLGSGYSRCDLFWDTNLMDEHFGNSIVHDRFRLPWADDVHNEWLRSISFTEKLEEALDRAANSGPSRIIYEASTVAGHPIEERELTFEPDTEEPLAMAVAQIMLTFGETPDIHSYELDASDVPYDIQLFSARILLAIAAAIEVRKSAIEILEGNRWDINRYYSKTSNFVLYSFSPPLDPTDRRVQDFLIGDFKYELLYQSAFDIVKNIELFKSSLLPHPPEERFNFNQSTPGGKIIISDGNDTSYTGTMASLDYLFVFDAGGNDHYEISAGANTSIDNPVSIAIDFSGNDTYTYNPVPDPNDGSRLPSDGAGRAPPAADYGPFSLSITPRQGSGKLGIGMLFDLGNGDDSYTSLRMSQGSGILGLGLLYDEGGNDIYRCEAGCQGSGIFGIGILFDSGMDGSGAGDIYESYHASQGFGYSLSAGILYDTDGNETYFCNQDDVLYPSPQDPYSNSSLCQGMGFGRRADSMTGGDGICMSGGAGVLRDLNGDDNYTSAIFGQGSGYWFGFGFLLDGGGSDIYNGRWYVQASAAHFANAVLHDSGGNDHYNIEESRRLNIILGGGHDFSNSFLMDDSGDDIYYSPNLSLGTGNDNGFGIFIDREGNDEMHCDTNYSFGNAGITPSTGREIFPSFGIFLQCGGVDEYFRPDITILGNDTTWSQKIHPDSRSEVGLGGDSSSMICGP